MKNPPFVSILTPTFNRRAFISQYLKCVRSQNYQGRIEVLIADDGSDSIEDLVIKDSIIRYFRFNDRQTLGYKRNLLANEARGDILVHMDDDDFYFPSRVRHAVDRLIQSQKLIAGASQTFFYNVDNSVITVSGPFGQNHAIANSFAYFKEYLKSHQFDNEAKAQEEPSFTNQFTEPMVQLDPFQTILGIQHNNNTWDKSKSTKKPSSYKLSDFVKSIEMRRFYKKLPSSEVDFKI
jgi:glycosyltransferase involved in cell wall biosynthesis